MNKERSIVTPVTCLELHKSESLFLNFYFLHSGIELLAINSFVATNEDLYLESNCSVKCQMWDSSHNTRFSPRVYVNIQ